MCWLNHYSTKNKDELQDIYKRKASIALTVPSFAIYSNLMQLPRKRW